MHDAVGRSWKLAILFAAGLGVLAFFQPFHHYELGDQDLDVSAYRILRGYQHVTEIDPAYAALEPWEQARVLADFNKSIASEIAPAVNGQPRSTPSRVPFYFLSVAGLLLIGLATLWTRYLGLFGALSSLAAGLWAIWGYTRELLIDRALARAPVPSDTPSELAGSGGTLLLVVGLLAIIAGIGGLAIADPGGFWRPRPKRPWLPHARLVRR